MKENKTTYSYLIEHMQNPSFQKVWDIAYDFVRKLPSDLCDELHESLNKGVDVLDSEPLMQMYIYSFGKMHNAKLQYAFEHLQENVVKHKEIEIVDYGCGQGLATICYHDFLLAHNSEQTVKRITLIEPSSMALARAELLCSRFFPNAEIVAINKQFDELGKTDLILSLKRPTLHLLSNILDVESYDLSHFSQLVKEQSIGDNEYVLVSPMQNVQRMQRLKAFASSLDKTIYYEQYLDKRQLDEEKDWTCAVLLCSEYTKRNMVEHDCDRVFEEALSFFENKNKDLDSDCCKELFYKLQVCASSGDKRCQNQLGLWYENGVGTEQNFELALEWYEKAAEQGYASAYGNIGNLYLKGKGVEQDFQKVFEYNSIGAEKNHPGCQYQLGVCYLKGKGVEKDYAKAYFWFKKSAEQDFVPAFNYLAACFYEGYGVEKSIKQTIHFLTKAAEAGNIVAIKGIIILFKNGKGVEYFGDEQFDVLVEAVRMELPEISSVINSGNLPLPENLPSIDYYYSFENTYNSILKSIKENIVRDNSRLDGLFEIDNASFIFDVLKNIFLTKNKTLGLYRRSDDRIPHIGNSLYPLVHDSNFVNIKKDVKSIPSEYISAPFCFESFWEIFLLDSLEYFLPKFDHYQKIIRHIVCSQSDIDNLPPEIKDDIVRRCLQTTPKITQILKGLVHIQCVYYNQWSGLIRWNEYYIIEDIHDNLMKVKKVACLSNQNEILYKYDCGLKI